ncbi:MAG: hypothetical protein ABSA11_17055 [Candidatus Bathyarchaeia archaeon]
MTVVNCGVQDCRHRLDNVCQRPQNKLDKTGSCVCFERQPGYLQRDLSKIYAGFAHPP